MVCTYGGEEHLWRPFEAAMARSEGIPLALELNSMIFADPARASAAALEALDAAIAALADESDAGQIVRIAMSATYVNRIDGCRDALWRVVRDARAGGAVASGITAMVELAYDDVEAGQWDEAEQLSDESVAACEAHGYDNTVWPCRYVKAVVAAARGQSSTAHEVAVGLVQWAGPRGIQVGRWFAAHVRDLVALGRGDFEEAYQQASVISPPGVLAPHVPFTLRVLLDLVEAALRTGRVDEAAAHVAAMQDARLDLLSSRLALIVGACAAMVAPDEHAAARFEAALALPDIERWQFDVARVRLLYGERLRRRRAMREAREQLNSAREIFARLKARPWLDRASAELRATGQSKPRAGDDVMDRLTPQEYEIVSLAATGLTNKQIGERLFLSPRTVGGHLHRAFPKLGVATRAALRDALAALPRERRPRD
jgi:DNA-binding CsgD family transcriptional regulator